MSIYLHVPGIVGEVTDRPRSGWIDVLEFTWGTRRRITAATSTGRDRESANIEITDLHLSRFMDRATPQLFLEACCGRGRTLTLELTKSGQGRGADTFACYQLHNAIVSAYQIEHLSLRHSRVVTNPRPVECLTISFVRLDVRYTPYDDDGAALPPVAVGFDPSSNIRL